MKKHPEMIVYCGPMWSGKTTALLSYAEKCKYQHKKIIAFKPKKDDRYAEAEIVSHSGWRLPAVAVENGKDMIRVMAADPNVYQVIAVDEFFMIPGAAEMLVWAFCSGITVVISTLDLSATGAAFPEVKKILPWATKIVKCAAVCSVCGADARYTHRKDAVDSDDEIRVGGDEAYEPRCFEHHPSVGEQIATPEL